MSDLATALLIAVVLWEVCGAVADFLIEVFDG